MPPGRRVHPPPPPHHGGNGDDPAAVRALPVTATNTRHALWPQRWPAIALQDCIDQVEAAPPEHRPEMKRRLPCSTCPRNGSCLNAKRKEIGSLLYDREIQTRPRASESSLFPFELFAPMLNSRLSQVLHWLPAAGEEHRWKIVSGWDLAWSEKVGGDWLVKVTAAIDMRTLRRRLLHVQRWQGLGYVAQQALIESWWRRFRDDLVVIESDAMQAIYVQTLGTTSVVPVIGHGSSDKTDLKAGIPGLLIELENRMWEFPYRADGLGFEDLQVLLAEFEALGWVDGKLKGVGEHDDTVAAFWHCSWGLRMLGGGLLGDGLTKDR